MIDLKDKHDVYFSSFAELEKLAGSNSWLQSIRQAAIERFGELGFPTTENEDWRFTNVAPIATIPFQTARYQYTEAIAEKLRRSPLFDLDCSRLVFVNGVHSPELSAVGTLPPGVRADSFAAALGDQAPGLEAHLARYANAKDDAFVALNTAFIRDGAFVEVPKGLVLEKPIYLLFVTTTAGQPAVSHPRNLVIVGRESQATVIEAHVGLGEGTYFSNAVTEIEAGESAIVDYYKLQQEREQAFHIATLQVHQERSSNVTTNSISLGGALVRQEANAVLDGEGAECTLNGLYLVAGKQHVDNYTTIDHAKPHCNSRELYKGVLDGKSGAVFHGRIIVRKDAQKTDAKQSNKNLLLSDDAVINTKPQLEIYADDVKCTHGATVGQIDQEAIFYMRSRGIALAEARSLLTYAFTNDVVSRIKYEPLRARLTDALFARLATAARK
jgi:Fe-S cluster assembly protein SufD